MIWVIAIVCVSLSCEPVPIMAGWFDAEDECMASARLVMEAWKPSLGFYEVRCVPRSVI